MAGLAVADIYFDVNVIEEFHRRFPEMVHLDNFTDGQILENFWRYTTKLPAHTTVEMFRVDVLDLLCKTYGPEVELNFVIDVFTNED